MVPIPVVETETNLSQVLHARLDALTKPPRSLGHIETLAHQLGMIQRTVRPQILSPQLLIFAADHGIAAEGVSLYPQSVTREMVRNFLRGGAAANVFARLHEASVTVVDAGLAIPLEGEEGLDCGDRTHARLITAPLGCGTRNFAQGPAMSNDQVVSGLQRGKKIIQDLRGTGTNTILFGEMGIGNSSAAAMITACLTGSALTKCVGRGTGLDEHAYYHKVRVLEHALERFDGLRSDPMQVAQYFGGFELVTMAGAYIEAAQQRCVILVDGFISSAALLLAESLAPGILPYAVFSHKSREQGHTILLEHFQGNALLDLGLALGEGSGALLALPLLKAACVMLSDMATFQSAQVSRAVSVEPL